jgi:hypothetical protein
MCEPRHVQHEWPLPEPTRIKNLRWQPVRTHNGLDRVRIEPPQEQHVQQCIERREEAAYRRTPPGGIGHDRRGILARRRGQGEYRLRLLSRQRLGERIDRGSHWDIAEFVY